MLSFVFHAGLKVAHLAEKYQSFYSFFLKNQKNGTKGTSYVHTCTNSLESAEVQSFIIILLKTVKPINFSYGYSKFFKKNYKTNC